MKIKEYWNDFLSLIYPNLCLGCDDPLPQGSKYICPKCHYNLPKTNTHALERHTFQEKFMGLVPFSHVLVYAYFIKNGIMQHVLHALKYNDNQEIGIMLGRWYGHDLLLGGYADAFDAIVPVPLHPKKQEIRGYNQAYCFAIGLSEVLKTPVVEHGLIRTKHIDSQTKKGKVNRILDVEGIFEVQEIDRLKDKRVLLVDDVLTTGSTLVACATPLLALPCQALSVAVMAGVK